MIRDWVELNMTPGIGPRAAAKLLERFGSAEAVYSATRAELEQLRLVPEAIDTIIGRDLQAAAEAEIKLVRKLSGDILLLDDGVYPSSLREIYDPPIVIYVKGSWSECLDQPCIAVVGSRRCSTYGQNAALMIARDLAQRGVTVVSGFARGIDAAAHRGALEVLSARSQETGRRDFGQRWRPRDAISAGHTAGIGKLSLPESHH
jgi:DNA processing protein